MDMGIQMVGIDHSRAGIDVRSIFSFTKKGMETAFEQLRKEEALEGCVMISTCNRMELWVSTKAESSIPLAELLCKLKQVDPGLYQGYFVQREGREAVDHLFEAILCLKDKEECYTFFEDVCTINEILSLSQRYEVARMLREQKTYLDIAEKTGASTATISRVNRSLNYGNDGYDMVFERLAQKEEKK